MTSPILYHWNGEAMVPSPRFQNLCDSTFVVGETYRLGVQEHRSAISHSHYFAAVNEAWLNLPEHLADRFPTSEHLRKYALIKAGYADERSIVCASKAEAQRIGAFIKPLDDFAVVVVKEAVVTVFTAKSQSLAAMGKTDFQASKQAVLDTISALIGVEVRLLSSNAGAAA